MAAVYISPHVNANIDCQIVERMSRYEPLQQGIPKLTIHDRIIWDATCKYNMIHALNKYDTCIMK